MRLSLLLVIAVLVLVGQAVARASVGAAPSAACAPGYRPCLNDGGSGALSRWGLVIRKPARKEAQQVKLGNTVWVAGWSPRSFKGERFELCTLGTRSGRCIKPVRRLNGTNQLFSTWTVRRGDISGVLLELGLRVDGRTRARDSVRVQ